MSKQFGLQCWEIIQCNCKDKCLLAADEEKACWEVVEEDNACSFHICVDCLVYLVQQDDSIYSDEELSFILSQQKERGIRHHECNLAYPLH